MTSPFACCSIKRVDWWRSCTSKMAVPAFAWHWAQPKPGETASTAALSARSFPVFSSLARSVITGYGLSTPSALTALTGIDAAKKESSTAFIRP